MNFLYIPISSCFFTSKLKLKRSLTGQQVVIKNYIYWSYLLKKKSNRNHILMCLPLQIMIIISLITEKYLLKVFPIISTKCQVEKHGGYLDPLNIQNNKEPRKS